MRDKRNVAWGQSAPVVASAAALWVIGVVALPLIFSGPAGTGSGPGWLGAGSGLVWLGVGLLITVLLLALVPSLARVLAFGLERLSAALASPDAPSSATFKSAELQVVARLLVLAGELLVVQAVLRRPIAIVLGGDRQVANVEAGIAAGALFLILPLLVWTYQTTRPMVQAATLRALDAAIPTIGTAVLVEPATGGSHVVAPPSVRRPTPGADEATAVSHRGDDKTAVSARAAARRRGPTRVSDDATAISPSGDDRTAVSPRDDDKAAATEVVGDEKTAISPRDGERAAASPPRGDEADTFVSPPRGDERRGGRP
jgi:hypothetical protein